jgi:PEP-CTERM motif
MNTVATVLRSTATALALLTLAALGTAQAAALPASQFTYTVYNGTTAICDPSAQLLDGHCTFTASKASGSAFTSGGTPGTPGYDPLLSKGTHVGANATFSGKTSSVPGSVLAYSVMTYFFTVDGPIGIIPVELLSSGSATAAGEDGFALAALSVFDYGTTANFGQRGSALDSRRATAHCHDDDCKRSDSWVSQIDRICVTTGEIYGITITAGATASGEKGSASSMVDPQIKIDPPYPATCEAPADPSVYGLTVSPGASTGYEVPEPATLGLMGLGLVVAGLSRRAVGRRRTGG